MAAPAAVVGISIPKVSRGVGAASLAAGASVSSFAMTPHKVSVCILLQVYVPSAQISVPFPFSSISHHNRLGIFLLSLTKSCDDIFEPKLDQLITQLREIGGQLDHWLCDHLTRRLSSISSPDDLFNFFHDLRGILVGLDSSIVDDDQIMLDPNSNLGMFLRRCLLAFNLLSFEGLCHLFTNLGTYYKETLSDTPPFALSHVEDSCNDLETVSEFGNMDLENFVFEKVTEEIVARESRSGRVQYHTHALNTLFGFVDENDANSGIGVSSTSKLKNTESPIEGTVLSHPLDDAMESVGPPVGSFLRSSWQIQAYLMEQANAIEKFGSSFPLNAFESILKHLQKLAPELHRVHFLRYLNSLYHDDYPAALENLHRYFDYSAGTEGFDFIPSSLSSCNSYGRYEIALLCLGMMHFHFGHPVQALEVLAEAVRVSQQHSDDTCLAYTLAAICNLLSGIGITKTSGIIRSSYCPIANIGTSVSIQQQLFVLLKQSIKRADSLKLKRLVASNLLATAKFDIMHVQRPVLLFGPKVCMKLRTCPANICKELRSSCHLISEFDMESSVMTVDGAFSTEWLKNLEQPMGSLIFSQDDGTPCNNDVSNFIAQPSSVPGSVLQLVGSLYLVRATAWEIYGSAPLAHINALVFATCFSHTSSSTDSALAYAKLIQHLAIFKGYKEAFAALKVAEEKFLSVSKSRILLVKLQLLHEHALHRGHLKLAQQLCDELGVLASPVIGVDVDLKAEARLRHARTLLAANQFSEAAAIGHSLFCMCYKFNMQVENANVLLLLAEIQKRSGNAVLGIPYALASISFCQSFNLDLLKASATLTLAELWLSLGSNHAKRSLTLLHGAFPIIVGHGGLELCARAFIVEAKCYLADPNFLVNQNPEIVLEPLMQASDQLELLEYHELAAEAFYLMAVIFNKLGDMVEREKAASSFKKHMIALQNPKEE